MSPIRAKQTLVVLNGPSWRRTKGPPRIGAIPMLETRVPKDDMSIRILITNHGFWNSRCPGPWNQNVGS